MSPQNYIGRCESVETFLITSMSISIRVRVRIRRDLLISIRVHFLDEELRLLLQVLFIDLLPFLTSRFRNLGNTPSTKGFCFFLICVDG